MGDGWHGMVQLPGGAGDVAGLYADNRVIPDDLWGLVVWGVEFVFDGEEGTQEQVTGVSHDGGAAGSDLVVGLELIELAEGMVDVGGGAEFLDVTDKGGGEVGLVEVLLEKSGVPGAEAGVGAGDGHTATAAASRALLTVRQNGGGNR